MGRIAIMLLVLTTILGLAHGYVGWRLIGPAKLAAPWSTIAWGTVVFLTLLHPASFSLRLNNLGGRAVDVLAWTSYILLGAFALTFMLVFFRDVVWGAIALLEWLSERVIDDPPALLPQDPERRRVLLNSLNLGILSLAGAGTAVGFYEARRRAQVVHVDVPIVGLPRSLDGFSIAQISDIHVGPTIKHDYLRAIVDAVNTLGADVVAVTGDLVDGSVAELQAHVAPLKDLQARHGAYFVTGNHEYYSGAQEWVDHVASLGLRVLMNEHHALDHDGECVLMCGVTDYTAHSVVESHRSDPRKAAAGAPSAGARILLAHQPRSLFAAQKVAVGPEQVPYDLMLSGHTHGGQFWPWNFLVGLANPVNTGLHAFDALLDGVETEAKKMWVYVNRGTGYWGPPLRLGVPSEITLLRLRTA